MSTVTLTCEEIARVTLGEPVKREGAELLWRCPRPERHANGDAHPSLKVNPKKDVFMCGPCGVKGKAWALAAFLAACDPGDKSAVKVWLKERGLLNGARRTAEASGRGPCVAAYLYGDANGNSVARKLRFEPGANGRKKDFVWQRWENGVWLDGLAGVRTPLYRLAEIKDCTWVVLTEGEKDADVGAKLGLPTTTTGAIGSFREDHAEILRGKDVVIISDADDPGREHAQKVATMLHRKAASVKVCELPGAKDLAEWQRKFNFSGDAVVDFIRKAPEWKPTAKTSDQRVGAVVRCFADIEPQEVRWLWPGRIPLGKLALLIGDPGLGKSLVTLDVVARVTRGESFPDRATCELGDAIVLSAEDDAGDTIRPRLDAARADVSRVHILEAVRVQLTDGSLTEKSFNLETDIAALEIAIREHPDLKLIVIDPVSAYLGGADSHSNAEVRGLLSPLAALAARYNVTVLCVTHLRKSAGAAVYRAIASIAFTAAARSVWAVAPDPEDAKRRLLLAVKQNLSADVGGLAFRIEAQNGAPRLAWDAEPVSATANEILNIDSGESYSEHKAAELWLREFLGEGPVAANVAIKAAIKAGISKTTLWRAANSLGVIRHKLGGRGAGWEWSLDSKISNSVCENVNSLESLTNSIETKLDTDSKISKVSKIPSPGRQQSLLLDDDDGEVRL